MNLNFIGDRTVLCYYIVDYVSRGCKNVNKFILMSTTIELHNMII